MIIIIWLVVSIFFNFHPYFGKIPILTNIFQRGWNHQLVIFCCWEVLLSFTFHPSPHDNSPADKPHVKHWKSTTWKPRLLRKDFYKDLLPILFPYFPFGRGTTPLRRSSKHWGSLKFPDFLDVSCRNLMQVLRLKQLVEQETLRILEAHEGHFVKKKSAK